MEFAQKILYGIIIIIAFWTAGGGVEPWSFQKKQFGFFFITYILIVSTAAQYVKTSKITNEWVFPKYYLYAAFFFCVCGEKRERRKKVQYTT